MGAFAASFYASALAKCHGCCRLRGCMEPGGSMAKEGTQGTGNAFCPGKKNGKWQGVMMWGIRDQCCSAPCRKTLQSEYGALSFILAVWYFFNAKLCLPNCCFLFAGFCFLLQESISKSALLRCAVEFSGRVFFSSLYLFLGRELQLCLMPTPLLRFLPSSTYCSFLIEMREDLLAGPQALLLDNSLLTDWHWTSSALSSSCPLTLQFLLLARRNP